MPYGREGTYVTHGPPGCGKTSSIAAWVGRFVEEAPLEDRAEGRSPVIVCSLTKAAAAEAAGRNMPLPPDAVGTLHSFGHRSLGSPPAVTWSRVRDGWNESEVVKQNGWHLSAALFDEDPEERDVTRGGGSMGAEALWEDYHLARHRTLDRRAWKPSLAAFALEWETFKREGSLVDFTDMIEFGGPTAHRAGIVIVDEAQDLSRLEHAYVQRLRSGHPETAAAFLVGDAFQALYTWRGAAPEALVDPDIPSGRVHVLRQSYRVPEAVRSAAVAWVSRLSNYAPIDYLPRRVNPRDPTSAFVEGTCESSHESLRTLDRILDDVESSWSSGRSVLLCGSWKQPVDAIVAALRERALPFSNPWRSKLGWWNPLAPRKGMTKVARLLAFVGPLDPAHESHQQAWTIGELAAWLEPVPVIESNGSSKRRLLLRGAKSELATMAMDENMAERPVTSGDLDSWLDPEFAAELGQVIGEGDHIRAAQWWLGKLTGDAQRTARYPVAVYARWGLRALVDPPRIHPSTIHGCKGGEADDVWLFPDIAYPARLARETTVEGADAIVRQFYVGMTRARERLVLCSPATQHHVRWTV